MNRKFLFVFALTSALVSSALGAPLKVIYATFIPQWNSVVAGSKPSLRVTLSAAPLVDTAVSLRSSDVLALTAPATVTVRAGSRYGIAALQANGVDSNTVVSVKASLDGFVTFATSPNLIITHASFLRATMNGAVESVFHVGDTIELKVTIRGAAGPSDYVMTLNVDPALAGYIPPTLTVPAGQGIARTPVGKFVVPPIAGFYHFGHIYIHLPDSPMVVDRAFLILP